MSNHSNLGEAEQISESGHRHDGPTRQAVLKLLKVRGASAASELSKELGLTEMAVRRHLQALEQDGFVETKVVKQAMGRPAYLFVLTSGAEQFFPRNYHVLALDLLEELEHLGDDAARMIDQLFEGRKRKLRERYYARMEGLSLEEKVRELAAIQNEGGYMAELERTESGDAYTLHEYNCPIAQVADRFNQACSCELALFRELLGTEVERTECLAKGGGRCTYRIAPVK